MSSCIGLLYSVYTYTSETQDYFFKTIFTEHICYDPNKRRELKNEHYPNQLDDQNRIALVILYNCICTVRSAHTAVAEQFWLKLDVTVELCCAKRKVIRKLMTVCLFNGQWQLFLITSSQSQTTNTTKPKLSLAVEEMYTNH